MPDCASPSLSLVALLPAPGEQPRFPRLRRQTAARGGRGESRPRADSRTGRRRCRGAAPGRPAGTRAGTPSGGPPGCPQRAIQRRHPAPAEWRREQGPFMRGAHHTGAPPRGSRRERRRICSRRASLRLPPFRGSRPGALRAALREARPGLPPGRAPCPERRSPPGSRLGRAERRGERARAGLEEAAFLAPPRLGVPSRATGAAQPGRPAPVTLGSPLGCPSPPRRRRQFLLLPGRLGIAPRPESRRGAPRRVLPQARGTPEADARRRSASDSAASSAAGPTGALGVSQSPPGECASQAPDPAGRPREGAAPGVPPSPGKESRDWGAPGFPLFGSVRPPRIQAQPRRAPLPAPESGPAAPAENLSLAREREPRGRPTQPRGPGTPAPG